MLNENVFDVVFIGGGISGIVASHELRIFGCSVKILEASSRLGGRCGGDADQWGIESGAEFIHGESATTWIYLEKFGIEAEPFPTSLYKERKYLAPNCNQDLLNQLVDWICGRCEVEEFVTSDSVGKFIYEILPEDFENDEFSNDQINLHLYYAKQFAIERIERIEGCDINVLPHLDYVAQCSLSTTSTRNFRILGGYRKLVNSLTSDCNVEFDFQVIRVEHVNDLVHVFSNDGRESIARYAIIAVPVSQLKNSLISFVPALSENKLNALNRIGLGSAIKISVEIPLVLDDGFGMLHSLESVPTWFNLGQINSPSSTVLLGFCGGETSRKLEALDDNGIIEAARRSLLGIVASSSFDPQSLTFVIHRWGRGPYIEESYSFPLNDGLAASRCLSLAEGSLHFAGEATSFNGNIGTVHGAIESGRRAAHEIIGRINSA